MTKPGDEFGAYQGSTNFPPRDTRNCAYRKLFLRLIATGDG